jgi:peptidyl-prolyl cis-trans isomerase SurA
MGIVRFFSNLIFILFISSYVWSAESANLLKPAAVVGNEIITEQDVQNRIAFIAFNTEQSLPADMDSLAQIRSEVLKLMIDEAIKRKIAERFNLLPEKDDVNAAIENIAQENGTTMDALKTSMGGREIPFEVFRQHVVAELAWRRYLRERYGATVRVSDQEIQNIQSRLEKGQSIPGLGRLDMALYTYGQVVFSLGDGSSKSSVDQTMRESESLRNSSKSLESLKERAKEFSGALYAEKELTPENEIHPAIVQFLSSLNPGESTKPNRIGNDIVFFFLKDRREVRGIVPEKDQIRHAIIESRLSRISKKALEDLYHDIAVEIRG